MDKELIEFFEKLDENGTLHFSTTYSVLSLKNSYYFNAAHRVASESLLQYLQAYEYKKILKQKYFTDNNNLKNAISTLHHSIGGASMLPHHVSAKFYQKILLGQSPIFNFAVVRNPYMRFYKYMNNYFNDDVASLIQKANKFLKQKDPHVMSITKIINYNRISYDFLRG